MSPNDELIEKRCFDIVYCIADTVSMAPFIKRVKENAQRYYTDFEKRMKPSDFGMLRVKLVVFRDYKSDGNRVIEESPFFELPKENEEFSLWLDSIEASGDCGESANGLEALYFAMKSDFVTGVKDRQIIVMFTDADALELKEREACEGYPADMVDEEGLILTWACKNQEAGFKLREKNKRLILFAPIGTKYEELSRKLNRSIFEPVDMGEGLKDLDFEVLSKILDYHINPNKFY